MSARAVRGGFTLIEMLTVIAIIALLISILLPSLASAREQAKRAYCLANLRSIGQASHAYATESARELLLPIHQSMRSFKPAADYWLWRTAMWFSFGGRSAPQPFLGGDKTYKLGEDPNWAAASRPMNRYLYGGIYDADAREMKLYRCPSDRGYPKHQDIDDSPLSNARRACYDTLGNSYRASLHCLLPSDRSDYVGAFAIGPWGPSTLDDHPARHGRRVWRAELLQHDRQGQRGGESTGGHRPGVAQALDGGQSRFLRRLGAADAGRGSRDDYG